MSTSDLGYNNSVNQASWSWFLLIDEYISSYPHSQLILLENGKVSRHAQPPTAPDPANMPGPLAMPTTRPITRPDRRRAHTYGKQGFGRIANHYKGLYHSNHMIQ